jgi:hypothetical protein
MHEPVLHVLTELINKYSGSEGRIYIDFKSLSTLDDELRYIYGESLLGDDPQLQAELMADVALKIYNSRGIIGYDEDPENTDSRAMHRIHHIYVDLSIRCAVSSARASGYGISLGNVPRSQATRALRAGKWEDLVRLFEQSLHVAGLANSPAIQHHGRAYADAQIQQLENQFINTAPAPEPSAAFAADRLLKAESYWNLNSLANQMRWNADVVIMLIEEHLFPDLHPNLVYHTDVVSSEEWLNLYNWIHREDGDIL